MKTLIAVLLALLFVSSSASAAGKPGDRWITFNAGYATAKSNFMQETFDGAMLSFTYEKRDWANPGSFLFSVGYASLDDSGTQGSDSIRYSVTSVPFYLGGKYWLGKDKAQFYLGASLGAYFSWLKTSNSNTGASTDYANTVGFGLGVPVGFTLTISEGMFINGNYTLNWLWSNQYVEDDIVSTFNLGLGFMLGK